MAAPGAAIKATLLAGVIDRWLPGWDTRTGYGQLVLGAPPEAPPAPFDVTPDGRSDIVLRSDILGATVCYEMDGTQSVSSDDLTPGVPAGWQIVAAGNLGGDGRADLVAVDPATRQMRLLITGGSGAVDTWILGTGWVVAGSADFNADGTDDLLFRNTYSGVNVVWLMRNGVVARAYPLESLAPRWQVAGVGDMDGDGAADILWRSSVTSRVQVWLLAGDHVTARSFLPTLAKPGWQIAGLADVDSDRQADVLWYHLGDGAVWADRIRNGQFAGTQRLHAATNPAFRIVATADYNGDGHADMLWRNMLSGDLYLYLRDGAAVLDEAALPGAGLGWSVVGPSTYDGARLAFAGGPITLAEVLGDHTAQDTARAPDASGHPNADSPDVGSPSPLVDPHAPGPGTAEGGAGEAVGTINIPADATVEQITDLTMGTVLGSTYRVVLPLVVR